jgi:hypothetical protein
MDFFVAEMPAQNVLYRVENVLWNDFTVILVGNLFGQFQGLQCSLHTVQAPQGGEPLDDKALKVQREIRGFSVQVSYLLNAYPTASGCIDLPKTLEGLEKKVMG